MTETGTTCLEALESISVAFILINLDVQFEIIQWLKQFLVAIPIYIRGLAKNNLTLPHNILASHCRQEKKYDYVKDVLTITNYTMEGF